ncbi:MULTISPECIES: hypothetical protein [unclassified Lentimonas]|uniref:hypothetical protein n=1 Tax=unclassified Lentimonas TaxID=2630993 RepID=UPI001320AB58|nr:MULTISPECIES: hypothetical protein [unclassified Lentimonas]CAA6676740.1 Unannotated [Lentimonas sp. CC4]CAA6684595.1 Unannotated [Lentimonas sp. CC6]CAA7075231.1 Unannotated [Lentimonas sp. CC4]CAA7170616.1 Unannotated [Lentimonas sp. CC21]CAA7182361.1 Unannotated [Lentimonas sp. CC8]
MKFLEKLFSAEQGSSLHGQLQQPEREAIVDLLLLGVYIDNHLSLSETSEFDSATEALGWESMTGPSIYINSATNRARDVRLSEDATAEFIRFAAQRLTSAGSKERALVLLNRLLMSDGKTDKEKAFFSQVEGTFAS